MPQLPLKVYAGTRGIYPGWLVSANCPPISEVMWTKETTMQSISRFLLAASLVVAVTLVVPNGSQGDEPPAGAVTADMGFPAPGTKSVFAQKDLKSGSVTTRTFTYLEDGTYKGAPVFQATDGVDTFVLDKATRNWIATLRDGKERRSTSPDAGAYSWPLWVGKKWRAKYKYRDHERGRSFDIRYDWKVEAYEDVSVPAGTFKAFRLHGRNPYSERTEWYAPEMKGYVKRTYERTRKHYLGWGGYTRELVEYVPAGS